MEYSDRVHRDIVLGALLHDIGKLVQRAQDNPREKRHQEWGAEWLNREKNGIWKEISDFAKFHHKLNKKDRKYDELSIDTGSQAYDDKLLLVYEADNLASGERENIAQEESEFYFYSPLASIFQHLSKEKNRQKTLEKLWVYELKSFIDTAIFPYVYTENVSDGEMKNRYKDILEELEIDVEKLSDKDTLNPDVILNLLHKHLLFIPSTTQHKKSDILSITDISLFHHVKICAAISSAIYKYFEYSNKEINLKEIMNRREKRYLLLMGDISGIQSFIYDITMTKALKNLRGRSFYLQLLTRHIINKLLKSIGLYRVSVIYEGGGQFTMLMPNTKFVKEVVEKIDKEINKFLFKEFRGKLYMNLGYIELSGNSFIPDEEVDNSDESIKISDAFRRLSQEILYRKKLRKFSNILSKEEFTPETIKYVCSICGLPNPQRKWEIEGEEIKVCRHCYSFVNLGQKLPTSNYIVYTDNSDLFLDSEDAVIIENTGYFTVNKALNGYDTISIKKNPDIKFESMNISRYPEEGEKEFEKLVEKAEGTKLLGVLRMDVDNLGYLISKGLPKNKRTFSRLSTLSEFLNIYFSQMVDYMANGSIQRNSLFPFSEDKKEFDVVVVYSGGDDLFLTGAWSDIVKIAFEINRNFKKFVCMNKDITISGSIVVTKKNYPIFRTAEIAGTGESIAKTLDNNTKNRLSLLFSLPEQGLGVDIIDNVNSYQSLRWREWEMLIKNVLNPIYNIVNKNKLSRSFLVGLWDLSYKATILKIDEAFVKPKLAYRFARHINLKENNIDKFQTVINTFITADWQQTVKNLKSSRKIFEMLLMLTKK